ncbi:MAG: OmpA family protein [Nitrospira sp.]|nr:OmpA family protein [Nitrospira sp.]
MRQVRVIMASSTFVLVMLLLQGCAAKWWWGAESGQEGSIQAELIQEPAIKEIPPDDRHLTDSRTSQAMQSDLFSRNATGLAHGIFGDVLFDFDQDTLRMDAMRALDADVKHLQRDRQRDRITRILLEGRGDESGTSAYNLVLGERRAKNVHAYLRELGLSIDVTTTSYGKDRPLCFDHSGECSQRNRSVHFVVK